MLIFLLISCSCPFKFSTGTEEVLYYFHSLVYHFIFIPHLLSITIDGVPTFSEVFYLNKIRRRIVIPFPHTQGYPTYCNLVSKLLYVWQRISYRFEIG